MKHLLTLAIAAAALLTVGAKPAQAGGQYQSNPGTDHAVQGFHRPVRYLNHRADFGWVPDYNRRCGRTPAQVFNYGFGGRITRHYTYPDVRSYNVYRTYPTSRAFSGFRYPARRH